MLKINNLFFSYSNHPVLNGIDISFEKGQTVGLLGLNGSGKTTLFRLIYGFLDTSENSITWNNHSIRKNDISFLETENYFYPYTKGIEYLKLFLDSAEKELQIYAWNEIFELPLDDFIDSYSTGMKKKLAFIGILLQDCPILLLDEPFNGVDLESSERMFVVLEKLRQSGKLIILSSHILSSLTSICDSIVHLEKGRVNRRYSSSEFIEMQTSIREEINQKMENSLNSLFEKNKFS